MKVKFCVRDENPSCDNDDLFKVLISIGAEIALKPFTLYNIDGDPYLAGESNKLDTSSIDYNVSSVRDLAFLVEKLDNPVSLKVVEDTLHVTVWNTWNEGW